MIRRNQRGAVTVEFAFVAPLLLLFLIGAVQVGLVVIGNSVGSNAARGARRATIRYECADNHVSARCPLNPSTNYGLVKAAVMERLSGLVQPSSVNVTVKCRQDSATGPIVLCENSAVNPDNDIVEVAVTWAHVGVTAWAPGTSHSSTARMVIIGRPNLASLVPEPDGFPPALTAAGITGTDPSADGIVDSISMTFDEDIIQSASPSAFTVTGSPTGSNTITSVSVVDRTVTLHMAGSSVNTATVGMTVTLNASSSGVRDIFGDQGSFGATAVADAAGPVLVGLTDTPGLTNGKLQLADTLTLTFSEPIWTAITTTTVVESDPSGAGNDSVSIGGVSAGPQLTNSNDYNTSNGSSVSVPAGVAKVGNTVIVTVGACVTDCLNLGTGADSGAFSITPATTLVDTAGNAARGSRTISNIF